MYPGAVPDKDEVFARNPLQVSNQVLILKIDGVREWGFEPISGWNLYQ
jgi:hypothetical protein